MFQGQNVLLRWWYPLPYRDLIDKHAKANQLDPLLVAAVIREESRFNPRAVSAVGAVGLMQLMPKTAHWIALRLKVSPVDLTDPETNVRLGSWYLRYLISKSGRLDRALAAYNGGEGNVAQWAEGEIRFPETKAFVERSLRSYSRYTDLYQEGTGP